MPIGSNPLPVVLSEFGIDIESWGKGEAKTISDLFEEMNQGECYLRIDEQGISRVVEIVKMFIHDVCYTSRGCLLEKIQILPDGRERQRNQHPSGKIKRGESPTECLIREIKEELNLGQNDYLFTVLPMLTEKRKSKSYPGLRCAYVIHGFDITLKFGCPVPGQEEFTIMQKDGTQQVFKWENPQT